MTLCEVEKPFWVQQDVVWYGLKMSWQGIFFEQALAEGS